MKKLLIVALMVGLTASAAPVKKKAPTHVLTPTSYAYPAVAFNPEWEALPPAFVPNNLESVIKSLTVSPKGEFETEEAFEKRSKLLNKEYFLIKNTSDKGDNFYFKYDTEQQRFILPYVYFSTMMSIVERISDQISVKNFVELDFDAAGHSKDIGSYIGQNSFGAKTKVTKTKFTHTKFMLPVESDYHHMETRFQPYMDIRHHKENESVLTGELEFDVPVEQARQLKAYLRLGFVFSPSIAISSSPVVTGTHYSPATISSPTDGTFTTRFIVVDTLWAVVFDSRNKHIYMVRQLYPPVPDE